MYDKNHSGELGVVLDDETQIWRYVPLPVLLQMLQTRTLFFPSIAMLAATDPWEGHWYPGEAPIVDQAIKESIRKEFSISRETENEKNLQMWDFPKIIQEWIGKSACVNCWHVNDGESAAMWAIYGSSHGIALQSRLRLLKSALAFEERSVAIAAVNYDYPILERREPPIRLAFRKRDSFSHEREIRAVVAMDRCNDAGTSVKVDLETLIEKMCLWPLAPPWMLDVVKAEIELHGLNKPITKSSLYDPV